MKEYEALQMRVYDFGVMDIVRTSEVDPAGADENWVTFDFEGGEKE